MPSSIVRCHRGHLGKYLNSISGLVRNIKETLLFRRAYTAGPLYTKSFAVDQGFRCSGLLRRPAFRQAVLPALFSASATSLQICTFYNLQTTRAMTRRAAARPAIYRETKSNLHRLSVPTSSRLFPLSSSAVRLLVWQWKCAQRAPPPPFLQECERAPPRGPAAEKILIKS